MIKKDKEIFQKKEPEKKIIKDIVKKYDEVTETAKLVMASGASRHDDKINEKNSKKYIKKNYGI